MTADTILDVRHLTLRYGRKAPVVVDDVSFDLKRGQTLGLVGESGSGKTTVGKAILGLLPVTGGTIEFDGRDITSIRPAERRHLATNLRAVFQDPYSSLNPRRPIGQALYEPLRVAGVDRLEAERRIRQTLQAVGLPADAAERLPRQFSGGQRQRIAIARTLVTNPTLIVCDEPVSALDLSTQAQVLNLFSDIQRDRGVGLLFIAHDISVVEFLSDRVVVLYRGQVMETGATAEVVRHPRHPFTRVLVAASPVPDPGEQQRRREAWTAMKVGAAGSALPSANGCPFATRCPLADDPCRSVRPALRQIGAVEVACHHPDGDQS